MSDIVSRTITSKDISDFVAEIFPKRITKFPKYLEQYIDKVLYSENRLLFLLFELDVFVSYTKIGNHWEKDEEIYLNGLVQDKEYLSLDYPDLIKDSK